MSLDVTLYIESLGSNLMVEDKIYIREDGQVKAITREEWDERFPGLEPIIAKSESEDERTVVFDYNITHNLGRMAVEAGIYLFLWRPDEIGLAHAHQLIKPLEYGLNELKLRSSYYKEFNPENAWGDYDGFVKFVGSYLEACKKYPLAKIYVSR